MSVRQFLRESLMSERRGLSPWEKLPIFLWGTVKSVWQPHMETLGWIMNAQVVAINAGKGGYQMQRWNYIESTFLDKSSWCLFNNYAISKAIGFQNIIIMSQARLAASLVSDSASGRDPSNSWRKPSTATCTPPPLHHVNTTSSKDLQDTAWFCGPCHSFHLWFYTEAALSKCWVNEWKVGGIPQKT